jgi:pimeloyl-ACP methyl ester carboxylesterase
VSDAAREFARREFSRDGVRLSYLDNDADGPVVVLLHGPAGCGNEFIPTAEAVGGRTTGARLLMAVKASGVPKKQSAVIFI